MRKVIFRIKQVLALVLAIADAVKGIKSGVSKGLADIKEAEQKAAFNKANDGNEQD